MTAVDTLKITNIKHFSLFIFFSTMNFHYSNLDSLDARSQAGLRIESCPALSFEVLEVGCEAFLLLRYNAV
jgi:hypothetical protein